AADDLDRNPPRLEEPPRLDERRHRLDRRYAPGRPADDVRALPGVALEAAEPERRGRRHGAGERQRGLARPGAGPAAADVDVDQDAEPVPGGAGRVREVPHVVRVVDHDEHAWVVVEAVEVEEKGGGGKVVADHGRDSSTPSAAPGLSIAGCVRRVSSEA